MHSPAPARSWRARVGEAVVDIVRAACLALPLAAGVHAFGAEFGYAEREREAALLTGVAAMALVLLLARMARARPLRDAHPRADGRITAVGLAVLALAFFAVAALLWSMAGNLRFAIPGAAAAVGMSVLSACESWRAWRRLPGPFRR